MYVPGYYWILIARCRDRDFSREDAGRSITYHSAKTVPQSIARPPLPSSLNWKQIDSVCLSRQVIQAIRSDPLLMNSRTTSSAEAAASFHLLQFITEEGRGDGMERIHTREGSSHLFWLALPAVSWLASFCHRKTEGWISHLLSNERRALAREKASQPGH